MVGVHRGDEHVPDQPLPTLCESCNEPIGAERLEALPHATTCFACANLRRPPSRGRSH
ncbi:TraR/DksA family transcriptional regulator [Pedococcus aerophilus]|uniref:TraR/DksA family transcriptional regulator n=1 Tax=Pedococcus aerophilus TaxID=436356 RepID=UPI003CD0764E